ncbi:MAG: FHA domain-containing protein FhaB/FipA [Nocardioidaceae bacterium]
MSELTLTLIKLGFLAVLWLFVLSAVSVIRSDIFGARVDTAKNGKQGKPAKAPKQSKQRKPTRGAPSKLVVVDGPNSGMEVPLTDGPLLIGRGSDAALRLDDDYVSTRHARIASNGEQWFVEDLGSTNGTYLGSQRVSTPTPIALGTPVRLGKTIVELRK